MKKDKKGMNLINKKQNLLLNRLLKLLIILFHFSFVINPEPTKKLYITKITGNNLNEIKIFDSSNNILNIYNSGNMNNIKIINNIYEINVDYWNTINISISRRTRSIQSVGLLLQIGDEFIKPQNSNFTVSFDNEVIETPTTMRIDIRSINIPNVPYYSINNVDSTTIKVEIPFIKIDCYETCLKCNSKGNGNNHKCLECDNNNGFYFKENDINEYNCYNISTFEHNYFLDKNTFIFRKCKENCFTCDGPFENNCTSCDNETYFFSENDYSYCYNRSTIGQSYYFDANDQLFRKCNERCLTCNGSSFDECLSCNRETYFEVDGFPNQCLDKSNIPYNYYQAANLTYYMCKEPCITCVSGPNHCTSCNYSENYFLFSENNTCLEYDDNIPPNYYLKNNTIYKCHDNCLSCSDGYDSKTKEMNCISCKVNYYFKNTTSTNCIKRHNKTYIDIYNNHSTLFPCHPNCETCETAGDDTNNSCTSCSVNYYFDDELTSNCVQDDQDCINVIGPSCAKCFKNSHHPDYGPLVEEKMCKRCRNNYYPLQKETESQFYVNCYKKDESPEDYFFDENLQTHMLCYESCKTCNATGNYLNHSCTSCEFNHWPTEEEPNNCLPKCIHYYYYNRYKQYKCTENYECPKEYPYLIENKTKCVDNCERDSIFRLLFENKCLQFCPDGFSQFRNNETDMWKCLNNSEIEQDQCKSQEIYNISTRTEEITNQLLEQYAKNYMNKYALKESYVTNYTHYEGTEMKYTIYLYKMERCAEELINKEVFVSFGLEECIYKIKSKLNILEYPVAEILFIKRKTIPQIKYFVYDSETHKRLETTDCNLTIIFTSGIVDEETVESFLNNNIDLYNKDDPFFTDICVPYSENGRDMPLEIRFELYFQNYSLCEEGCRFEKINTETHKIECFCETTPKIDMEKAKELFDNPLSSEIVGFIEKTNLDVFKCYTKAFASNVILDNYAGLIMAGITVFQCFLSIIIKCQSTKMRDKIYSKVEKLNSPPKREKNKDKSKNNKKTNTIGSSNIDKEDIISESNSSGIDEKQNEIKQTLNIKRDFNKQKKKKKNNQKSKKYNINAQKTNTNSKNNIRNFNINKNISQPALKYLREHMINSKIEEDKENENNEQSKIDIDDSYKKNLYFGEDIEIKDNQGCNLNENEREVKLYNVKGIKKGLRRDVVEKMKELKRLEKLRRKIIKERFVTYEVKDYENKDLNDLEYEEAIMHDRRNCCQMFGHSLQDRQIIVNTFCSIEELKPFSIKLSVLLLNLTFYFIIDGLLYNKAVITDIFNAQRDRTISEYFVSSIDNIVYNSIASGIISSVTLILFDTDKKIEETMRKYKDNKIIMKGELSKIYKCYNLSLTIYGLSLFVVNGVFTFYVFCLCYAYPHILKHWCQVSVFVISLMQLTSFLTSLLISFLKFLSVRFRWEICFKINIYLEENL